MIDREVHNVVAVRRMLEMACVEVDVNESRPIRTRANLEQTVLRPVEAIKAIKLWCLVLLLLELCDKCMIRDLHLNKIASGII